MIFNEELEGAFKLIPTGSGGHVGPVDPIPTVIPTPPKFQEAQHAGFRVLWVVFVLMVLASGSFALASWRVPVSRRAYHFLITLSTIVGTLSYFAMAAGAGSSLSCTTARQNHEHVPDTGRTVCREVYWARYVDWAVSTPMLLGALSLLAGIDGAHTLMAVSADLIMKLAGLFAAFGREHTAQRWGWYAISWVSFIFVIWHVALHGSTAVRAKGSATAKAFGSLAGFALILWTIYPIVWGISSGARKIDVDKEIIIYAVLDVLTKAGFGAWLLASLRRVPEANVELDGYWSQGAGAQGRIRIGDNEEGA